MNMPLNELTPAAVRRAGREALTEKLGPASALKFISDIENLALWARSQFSGFTI